MCKVFPPEFQNPEIATLSLRAVGLLLKVAKSFVMGQIPFFDKYAQLTLNTVGAVCTCLRAAFGPVCASK